MRSTVMREINVSFIAVDLGKPEYSRSWVPNLGVGRPRGRGWLTRSASESSSCPIILLFLRHRATLPSIKSKKSPRGIRASAA